MTTTERPILFSGPMVRAILEGSKTQTRRVIKPQPEFSFGCWYPCKGHKKALYYADHAQFRGAMPKEFSPYGKPGDRLWVRETWADMAELTNGDYGRMAIYRDDNIERYGNEDEYVDVTAASMLWRPSTHMPRWASRITLEITGIRVERLQEISGKDVLAEGVDNGKSNPTMGIRYENMQRMAFQELWQSTYGNRQFYAWSDNPWVFVIEFKRIEP